MAEQEHIRDNHLAYLEELNSLSEEASTSFVWGHHLRARLKSRGFDLVDEVREKTGKKKADDPTKDAYHKVKREMSQRQFNRFTTTAKAVLKTALIKDGETEDSANKLVDACLYYKVKDFKELDLGQSKHQATSVKDWLSKMAKKSPALAGTMKIQEG